MDGTGDSDDGGLYIVDILMYQWKKRNLMSCLKFLIMIWIRNEDWKLFFTVKDKSFKVFIGNYKYL